MPTYEYECLKCGHSFEKFQSISDDPLKRCPKCRCKVKRLPGTGAGIIFKGSGFYETDYKRGKSYQESAKKDTEAPKESKSEKVKSKKAKESAD